MVHNDANCSLNNNLCIISYMALVGLPVTYRQTRFQKLPCLKTSSKPTI